MTHDERDCDVCEQDSSREVWHHALWFTVLGFVGLAIALGWHP